MSSLPKGQWVDIACFSTSLGVLKAFIQPFHSHKNGKAGLGLGIVVTLNDETDVVDVDVPDDDEGDELVALFGDSGDVIDDELPLTWPLTSGRGEF